MNLFVYESLTAGALGAAPASLRTEGSAMLKAVASDFAKIANVSTLLSLDADDRLDVRCHRTNLADEPQRFRELVDAHDATLVIAPEFDGILAQRSELVLARGRRLLGCHPEAVRRAADKFALAAHWRKAGVLTPPTSIAATHRPPICPAVVKPRDGAGSQAMRLIVDPETWAESVTSLQRELPERKFIVQPLHAGKACSVAFLIGPTGRIALPATQQILSDDGRFTYRGGRLPLSSAETKRAHQIASAAIDVIDGLAGYVGVDLILGENGDDAAIEINPRLTTSYIGLRALCRDNLAKAWLSLLESVDDVNLRWRPEPIEFDTTTAGRAP